MKRKWTTEELTAYDRQFEGRLNPRASTSCDTCNKFYGAIMRPFEGDEKPCLTLIADEDGNITDCVHYDDVEIPERIYAEHMEILKRDGLYDPDDNETLDE